MKKYYRRLALKRFIFCLIYTFLVFILISYCGDRYSITTSNITNVKSIESDKIKSRYINEDIKIGTIKYINKENSYNVSCVNNIISDDLYNEATYGQILILKTNSSFLCGNIIKLYNLDNKEEYGIVLDIDNSQSNNVIEILTINKENEIEKEINYSIVK